MSAEVIELTLGLDESEEPEDLQRKAARKLRMSAADLGEIEVLRRSIDARRGRVRICYLLRRRQEAGPMIDGAKIGVYVLYGLVVLVQIGIISFFLVLRNRAKKYAEKQTTLTARGI